MLIKRILNILAIVLIISLICAAIITSPKSIKGSEPLGYVDLSITYRNYIVSNKFLAGDDYVMLLLNPITKESRRVKVRDHVYICNYFVGDTIK